MPHATVHLTLPYTPPYDWPAIIGFLAARAIPGVERVEPGCYARTIRLHAACGSIAVRPAEAGHTLHATIRGFSGAAVPAIVARIRRIFDLDADPEAIGAHLAADPYLAPLVAARPGLRVPGAWDGFELAARAILGQQITVAGATTLAGKLAAACGTPLPPGSEAGLARVFPMPESLAGQDLGAILGMPRARAAALSAMAARVAAEPGLFDAGQDAAGLMALPGIGAWTAQYIAMRALREPDAFPAADVGLLRALATPAGRPTPAQALARAEAWRPWRAYAALHLWTAGAGPATLRRAEDSYGAAIEPVAVAAGDAAAGR